MLRFFCLFTFFTCLFFCSLCIGWTFSSSLNYATNVYPTIAIAAISTLLIYLFYWFLFVFSRMIEMVEQRMLKLVRTTDSHYFVVVIIIVKRLYLFIMCVYFCESNLPYRIMSYTLNCFMAFVGSTAEIMCYFNLVLPFRRPFDWHSFRHRLLLIRLGMLYFFDKLDKVICLNGMIYQLRYVVQSVHWVIKTNTEKCQKLYSNT